MARRTTLNGSGIVVPRELDLPVLPTRDFTLFPRWVTPLTVARGSVRAAVDALGEPRLIAVIAQRDSDVDDPDVDDLQPIGTVALVIGQAELAREGGSSVAFVKGLERIRVQAALQHRPYLRVRATVLDDVVPRARDSEVVALQRNVHELVEEIVHHTTSLPDDLLSVLQTIDDPAVLSDFVAASLPLAKQARQELLETLDVRQRLRRVLEELFKEREELLLKEKIHADVAAKLGAQQRRFVLHEQLAAIRRELGETDDDTRVISELREQLERAELPDEAAAEAKRELARLEHIPDSSPEHHVVRTYLEWLADLPWRRSTATEQVDIARAAAILDADHHDLESVKERILELLAVYRLKPDVKGPILCLVGPPGVGKTSLGRSIARATGRSFARISLGGMHDEAEIRGHRRTYIGALPGQIIQQLRRAGSNDPVFMLDEIDKIGRDFRGDPAAALLEVLDPEQNETFRDHYLDVPFDLSKVLFIATANVIEPVSPTLRDRMEVLELAGYVDEEKIEIARRFLIPKQARAHGLDPGEQIRFTDDGIVAVIQAYTREAGVRALEQRIAALCRKCARRIVGGGADGLLVDTAAVSEHLGAPQFRVDSDLLERTRVPGVAVGLAWTPQGGEVLFVEVSRVTPGKGEFLITGQVGDVMRESARAALSWVRAHAARYGLDSRHLGEVDLHLHIPAGAVPKDGPSAGIAIAVALLSLLSQQRMRRRVALTGEITLGGLTLPVGGIKHKVLAARRAGVREIVMPADNRANVHEEIAPQLRDGLTFHFVRDIEQAVDIALSLRTAPVAAPPAPRATGLARPRGGVATRRW